MIPTSIQSLTLMHAVVLALVAIAVAIFVVPRGLLHSIAWLVALGALAIGLINKVSYG